MMEFFLWRFIQFSIIVGTKLFENYYYLHEGRSSCVCACICVCVNINLSTMKYDIEFVVFFSYCWAFASH